MPGTKQENTHASRWDENEINSVLNDDPWISL